MGWRFTFLTISLGSRGALNLGLLIDLLKRASITCLLLVTLTQPLYAGSDAAIARLSFETLKDQASPIEWDLSTNQANQSSATALRFNLPVETTVKDDRIRLFVQFKGKLLIKDASLLFYLNKVQLEEDTQFFQFKVYLKNKTTPFEMTSISPLGEVIKLSGELSFEDFENYKVKMEETFTSKSRITAAVGVTLVEFSQKVATVEKFKLSEKVLTLKASYAYPIFPPSWDVGFNLFASPLVLSGSSTEVRSTTNSTTGVITTAPAANTLQALYAGVNARIGYSIPGIKPPFRVSLMVGGYFNVMYASGGQSAFGYPQSIGPQFYPTVSYQATKTFSIGTYTKLALIADGTSFSLQRRELAAGLFANKFVSKSHAYIFGLDYANLSFEKTVSTQQVLIANQIIAFSVGYLW